MIVTTRESSLALRSSSESGLALRTVRDQNNISLGFESDEAWGTFTGSASVSSARARSGTQALKINASLGGSAMLTKRVGPTEGKTVSAWVYIETAGTGASLSVFFAGIGRSVDFQENINLNGVATGSWVEVTIPNTAILGSLTFTSTIKVVVLGAPAPVAYLDDMTIRPGAPALVSARASSLSIVSTAASSLALRTTRTT